MWREHEADQQLVEEIESRTAAGERSVKVEIVDFDENVDVKK